MDNQEQLRKDMSIHLNSLHSLAKKWGIDPYYLNRWYNGLKVGSKTENKIRDGLKKLNKR